MSDTAKKNHQDGVELTESELEQIQGASGGSGSTTPSVGHTTGNIGPGAASANARYNAANP